MFMWPDSFDAALVLEQAGGRKLKKEKLNY